MKPRIITLAATAALILTLILPAAAFAWPAPPPTVPPAGVDVCVPAQPRGSFVIEHVTTQQRLNELRSTRGTHVAENGRCEGPVTPAPTPVPTPTPPSCGTTITCPPPVVIDRTVTVIQQVPVEQVCTSRRIITHRVAQTQFGRLVTGVRANSPGYPTTVRRVNGRWVVSVDVRGEQFTGFNNNVRTRVVVKLGRRAGTTRPIARPGWWRTVYKADTCRSRKGAADQNDVSSRTPLIPVPSNAVTSFLAR